MGNIEFVAPYSLEECVERLESQHQPPATIRNPHQKRFDVKIKNSDAQSVHFVVKRLFKIQNMPGSQLVKIVGDFIELSPSQTEINAEIQINWIATALFLLSTLPFTFMCVYSGMSWWVIAFWLLVVIFCTLGHLNNCYDAEEDCLALINELYGANLPIPA